MDDVADVARTQYARRGSSGVECVACYSLLPDTPRTARASTAL